MVSLNGTIWFRLNEGLEHGAFSRKTFAESSACACGRSTKKFGMFIGVGGVGMWFFNFNHFNLSIGISLTLFYSYESIEWALFNYLLQKDSDNKIRAYIADTFLKSGSLKLSERIVANRPASRHHFGLHMDKLYVPSSLTHKTWLLYFDLQSHSCLVT